MTAPRIDIAGATVATSRRTICRKAFLAPWHDDVQAVVLYALADGQAKFGFEVHHLTTVVNHYHGHFTAVRAATFIPSYQRFHRDVSCALQELMARHGYDIPHELWDHRKTHVMRLMDPEAQAAQLVYDHLNVVTAGLVARPEDTPGVLTSFRLWKTGSLVVPRPNLDYFASRPNAHSLVLNPPPLLYRAFGGDLDALIHHLERCVHQGVRTLRQTRKRPVLGAPRMRRLHPWDEPRTLRETRQHRTPSFKYGAAGSAGVERRVDGAREVRAFRDRHRATLEARRKDRRSDATWPFGTYEAVALRNEPADVEPSPDAAVCRPGPSFADIVADLSGDTAPDEVEQRKALFTAVEEAVTSEAQDAVEANPLDFDRTTPAETPAERSLQPRVVVRHRFGSHRDFDGANRVVPLRDRRRRGSVRQRKHVRSGSTGGPDPPG